MRYFDNVKEIIEKCSSNDIKELKDCPETIELFNKENGPNNPYRKLAKYFFVVFKKGSRKIVMIGDNDNVSI